MRAISTLLSFATATALASCGIVSQGAGAGGAGGPTSATLGERAVPGYTLTAEHLSDIRSGQPCTVRVLVTPDSGQAAVTDLVVWLGTSTYDPSAVATTATAVPGQASAFDATVVLPTSLPVDAAVWVRLTTADGAVLEAGREAFSLAAR